MYDFDHAEIYVDGTYRPLVKERRLAVPSGIQMRKSGFPLSPLACEIILLLVGLTLFLVERKQRRIFVIWDVLLMITTGTIGLVLFMMLFSQHPTVNLNLQFILFNPLPWFFLWKVIRKQNTCYWTITLVLSILFLVGGFFQDYASGTISLALCLMMQCCLRPNWKKIAP